MLTLELTTIPSLKSLLVKLAFNHFRKPTTYGTPEQLPQVEYKIDKITINEKKCVDFHNVTKWKHTTGFIHPCLVHSIAFPIHLSLLLLPEFPFPLLGLVHIGNQIQQYRPIMMGESLSLRCKFKNLSPHQKGWTFSIEVKAYSGNQLVWESVSTNLFKNQRGVSIKSNHIFDKSAEQALNYGNFKIDSRLGRQYARCSGDYNPIHLTKWSSKLFGFKKSIAHGMWTKSRCLSALFLKHPLFFETPFMVNVSFKKPLYLPNNISMFVQKINEVPSNKKCKFTVESANSNKHLIGCFQQL